MKFLVKTLTAGAAVEVIQLEAASAAQARAQLTALGASVLSVSRAQGLGQFSLVRTARFPLLLFSQELLSLLDSGVTIVDAVETLSEKEARPEVRGVLQGIVGQLRQGKTFSAALEAAPQAFAPLYVATVRASEKTSGLSEALKRYVAYAQQLDTLRGKLVSAAIYPVLLIGGSSLVVLFLMGYVVPRFAHIYEDMGGDLPFMSRLLLQGGLLIEHYWSLMLIALGGLVAAMVLGGGRWLVQKLLTLLWRIPSVGERMRVFQLARMYRTLGMLLRGGIAITQAMDMVAGLLTDAMQTRLLQAGASVREGQSISHAFEVGGLTTAVALRMLRVGERTGNMGEMMERIAVFHDDEMARWAEWVTRLLGPILMLIMGLVIGVIVVLMYMPIFQLAEGVK